MQEQSAGVGGVLFLKVVEKAGLGMGTRKKRDGRRIACGRGSAVDFRKACNILVEIASYVKSIKSIIRGGGSIIGVPSGVAGRKGLILYGYVFELFKIAWCLCAARLYTVLKSCTSVLNALLVNLGLAKGMGRLNWLYAGGSEWMISARRGAARAKRELETSVFVLKGRPSSEAVSRGRQ